MIQASSTSWRSILAVAVVLLFATVTRPALAGQPTDELRMRMDQAFGTLADRALQKPENAGERRQAVFTIAEEMFDFRETARLALGPPWDGLSSAEQAEFVQLFTSLIERSYIKHVEMYDRDTVVYSDEAIDDDQALVRTKIITKHGHETAVDYRMILKAGDHWRIYDVNIEGVSLVATYRTQFKKLIHRASYQELVRRLKDKQGTPTRIPSVTPAPSSESD